MTDPTEREGIGPLTPEQFEAGVRSLCAQFPDLPENAIRQRLLERNSGQVQVNHFLTALAMRDLLDMRLRKD
jgi:hypothetical protein